MLEVIKNRHSCRSFKDQVVEDEKIEQIVEAGLYAPTGKNTQETICLVIKNKEKRDLLAKVNVSIMGREGDPFYGAPVVLVVFGSSRSFKDLDGGAMVENMLLEAEHLGLGTCWIHRAYESFLDDSVKEAFKDSGIDFDQYYGVANIALGYSNEKEIRKKIIKENRVFWVK